MLILKVIDMSWHAETLHHLTLPYVGPEGLKQVADSLFPLPII